MIESCDAIALHGMLGDNKEIALLDVRESLPFGLSNLLWSVPYAVITYILDGPSRVELKAIRLPSGAQDGASLSPALCVNCTGSPPSTLIENMLF